MSNNNKMLKLHVEVLSVTDFKIVPNF